jgi:lipopolysaccharide export system protein LptA
MSGMRRPAFLFFLIVMAGLPHARTASAQTAPAQTAAIGDGPPLEIEADDGLEWRRDEKSLIATGNVLLVRGDLEIRADTVNARYRERTTGAGEEVYLVIATGNVRITSQGTRTYSQNATYDLDQSVFVLTGGHPWLETADTKVSARQNLEYWQAKQLIVARGGAVAETGDRKLSADILSAFLKPGDNGEMKLRRLEALGSVQVTTPDSFASGDEAVYDAASGLATLCGDVEIQRGPSRLSGKCAEINLITGVSRLLGGGGRIKGLMQPGN